MQNAGATANWFFQTSGLNLYFTSAQNGAAIWNINGSEQMRLTSTGLGIGTSSPSAKLTVAGTLSASGTITASNAAALTVPNGYQTLYRTTNDTSSLLHLQFFRGSGAGAFAGIYTTGDAANGVASLNLNINGTDIAKASSTGLAVTGTIIASTSVGVGNTTPSGGGAGIAFPATQSASSDANTLDDYEEGTWTPNQGSGLTVVGTFSSTGNYVKVGKMVTVQVSLAATTSITISAGDAAMFTNLPFASSPTRNPGVAVNTAHSAGLFVNIASTTVYSCGSIVASATIFLSITYQTS
jgi:hypothetical protein